jgi:hypothetical protein
LEALEIRSLLASHVAVDREPPGPPVLLSDDSYESHQNDEPRRLSVLDNDRFASSFEPLIDAVS